MPAPSDPRHVLAVDNDQAVLGLFRTLLEEEGYQVSTRAYVDKGLDEIKTLAPDLIILDYMWPDEDGGWSLLQMLRMDRETAVVPIVLCTGAVREVEALQGHLEEMKVRVVLKPFNIDRLNTTIAEALAAAESRASARG